MRAIIWKTRMNIYAGPLIVSTSNFNNYEKDNV